MKIYNKNIFKKMIISVNIKSTRNITKFPKYKKYECLKKQELKKLKFSTYPNMYNGIIILSFMSQGQNIIGHRKYF